MNFSALVNNASQITSQSTPKPIAVAHTIELRSMDVNLFGSLVCTLQNNFPALEMVKTDVNEDATFGIAILYSYDKELITSVEQFFSALMGNIKQAAFKHVSTDSALKDVMDINVMANTFLDRKCSIKDTTTLPEILLNRQKERERSIKDNLSHESAIATESLYLNTATIEQEIAHLCDFVTGIFDNVDGEALSIVLHQVAKETDSLFADNGVIDGYAAQGERFALNDLIKQLASSAGEEKATILVQLLTGGEIKESSNIIREQWEKDTKTLENWFNTHQVKAARKYLLEAKEAYFDNRKLPMENLSYKGLSAAHALTSDIEERLGLPLMVNQECNQSCSSIRQLAGALASQLSMFITVKKEHNLKLAMHTIAHTCMSRLNNQKTFPLHSALKLRNSAIHRACHERVVK
jgi:hypothetical protein